MCGRFQNAQTIVEMVDLLAAVSTLEDAEGWRPSWNIRPTDHAPVAIEDESRRLGLMRWGWQPSWAKRALINARSDTLASSRTWYRALRERRCVIPATGWWEWQGKTSPKTPYAHRLSSGEPFTLAGLWTREGDEGRFVVVVTEACASIDHVHDRMPVLLLGTAIDRWLDPASEEEDLLRLCTPAAAELVECHPVSPFRSADDGPELVEPR